MDRRGGKAGEGRSGQEEEENDRGEERPRTDQAHLSSQDVPQLGKLVDARGAQESSKPCDPVGVGRIPDLVRAGRAHRPELEHRERLSTEPGTDLAEQNRRALRDELGNSDPREQRG